MSTFVIRESHGSTEDIYWEHGRMGANGQFRYSVLTNAAADGLRAKFGAKWLAQYLADAKIEIDRGTTH